MSLRHPILREQPYWAVMQELAEIRQYHEQFKRLNRRYKHNKVRQIKFRYRCLFKGCPKSFCYFKAFQRHIKEYMNIKVVRFDKIIRIQTKLNDFMKETKNVGVFK